jgi:hypothetical protein
MGSYTTWWSLDLSDSNPYHIVAEREPEARHMAYNYHEFLVIVGDGLMPRLSAEGVKWFLPRISELFLCAL